MIALGSKEMCCGCSACVQACPKQCIAMVEDEEGFLYPHIDLDACVNCAICETVCLYQHRSADKRPLHVYAAKNVDENIRLKSSSGGVFSLIAEHIIAEGGVVFGAKFDEQWNVIHCVAETLDEVDVFRGSKYVQSTIGNCYKQVQSYLEKRVTVLFSGTPCQIAGLRCFLRKDYTNLLLVDVVCHGAPSPLVWQKYLQFIARPKGGGGKNTVSSSLKEVSSIEGISFRDKLNGWKKYGFSVYSSAQHGLTKNSVSASHSPCQEPKKVFYETLHKNLFMQGFLKNLYLRPSCHACPVRKGKSGSDISIGDFWGIGAYLPEWDDDKGISLVLVNTDKGQSLYESLRIDNRTMSYQQALVGNPMLEKCCAMPPQRSEFWELFDSTGVSAISAVCRKMRPSFQIRLKYGIKSILLKVLGKKLRNSIRHS